MEIQRTPSQNLGGHDPQPPRIDAYASIFKIPQETLLLMVTGQLRQHDWLEPGLVYGKHRFIPHPNRLLLYPSYTIPVRCCMARCAVSTIVRKATSNTVVIYCNTQAFLPNFLSDLSFVHNTPINYRTSIKEVVTN